jgi:hypothetical protein
MQRFGSPISCCGRPSVKHQFGSVLPNGFLLDMPRLFEDFVTMALRRPSRQLTRCTRCRVCHDLRAATDVGLSLADSLLTHTTL